LSKITFINTFGMEIESPKPAFQFVPDWYKQHPSYLGSSKKIPEWNLDGPKTTIKRCMPVFDAISAGYIITLPVEIYVSIQDVEGKKSQLFQWPNDLKMIDFHPIEQALNHPLQGNFAYPKFINPWGIKTPKGYSTLFVQPFHREAVFTILPGIVDTDTYSSPVNFPFVINDPTFEGYIKKGTPIAQVIPFKRESWKMEVGSEKEFKEQHGISQKLHTKFFDKYKSMFWSQKEYK